MTDSATLFSSLDCSDTPPPQELSSPQVQPFVGQSLESLTTLSDDALRTFERSCFSCFQVEADNYMKGRWLHAMAAAIVELHRRGLSMNGDWQ
jgi:hypothetical protein